MTTNYITNALALLETYAKMIDSAASSSSTSEALRRFEGNGIPFRAKLIGMEDLNIDRDEKLCLDSMFKLKAVAKARGEHKQRIQLQLTTDSVKMVDELTKTQVASHEIERISFVVLDPKDTRAFGYVFNTTDDRHQFWAIKTEKNAALTVATLKELFDLAFELYNQKQKSSTTPTEPSSTTPIDESKKDNNETKATTENNVAPKTENAPDATKKAEVDNLFDLSTPVEPLVNQPPPQQTKAPILIDDIFGDLNLNTVPTPVKTDIPTVTSAASPFAQPNIPLNVSNPVPTQPVYVQPNVSWNMANPTPVQTGFAQPNVAYNIPNPTVPSTGYMQPGVPLNMAYPVAAGPTGFVQPTTMAHGTYPEIQQPIYSNMNTRQPDAFNMSAMPSQNVTLANSSSHGVDGANPMMFPSTSHSADFTSSGNSFSSSSFDPMSPGPSVVPSVPPTLTNPMSSFDMFNLLSGPAARPTRDSFFPNQPAPKTIQQLQVEKNP